jgi:hypothetical protein
MPHIMVSGHRIQKEANAVGFAYRTPEAIPTAPEGTDQSEWVEDWAISSSYAMFCHTPARWHGACDKYDIACPPEDADDLREILESLGIEITAEGPAWASGGNNGDVIWGIRDSDEE